MERINTGRSLTDDGTHASLARQLLLLSLVLAVCGLVALPLDLSVAYLFVSKSFGPIWTECRGGLLKIVQPGETYANGWAIVLMVMLLYAADVARRRNLLRLGVVVLACGLLANVGKLLLARWRPRAYFDFEISAFRGGVLDSFGEVLPLASLGYQGQSVPSGHTATAVALTIVLCRRWPHARWALLTLLGMAVMQRISFGHHYPSDCCWGAALACAITAVCYHPRLAGGYFDRFERGTARSPATESMPGTLVHTH